MLKKITAVIPAYKVKNHILNVISACGEEISTIFVIDDACPEQTGDYVKQHCRDPRVVIIKHATNLGVGGAVMTGYKAAIADDADIIVKIDGDGQMDPTLVPNLVSPIIGGWADYVKGNRFFNLEKIYQMPLIRIIGNVSLSFMSKVSTGYWNIFDPTNGFTAINARVAELLPFEKISPRYFFETDILFRLNTLRAVVVDMPMDALYGNEKSNLRIKNILFEFFLKNLKNTAKRIFYNYFLRDLTIASIELIVGSFLLVFGIVFGITHWISAFQHSMATPVGTITISSLSVLCGLQLLIAFLNFDINYTPTLPINRYLNKTKKTSQFNDRNIVHAE